MLLEIHEVQKKFNNGNVIALNNVSLNLEQGNILAVVGESGSGKTTLIRLVAGLETLDKGEIIINNKMVSSNSIFIEPQDRKVGMVFQDYALFPHFTVFDNIAYGISKLSSKKERVDEVLQYSWPGGFREKIST